jgi:regulator of protease activity HflC (stomatin/prohibitin superfamily)
LKRRRTTVKKAKEPSRSGPGLRGLFLATFLLAVLGFVWQDAKGVRLGVLGSYVWVMALFIAFFATAMHLAQFILPLRGEIGWLEGFRLILNNLLFSVPGLTLHKGVHLPPGSGHLSPSFKALGAGIVESYQTIALARGASFTRAAGPGFVRLNRSEHVSHLVDLRPQRRKLPVKAITRDGIPLDTSVSVMFQIRQDPNEPGRTNVPYPYDSEAIFQVCYFGTVGEQENEVPWGQRLVNQAAADLVTALSRRTLDELYQADEPGADPMVHLKNELQEQLRSNFTPKGIEILSVSIGALDLPLDVMEQRIQSWQANWEQRIRMEMASGNAEAIRRLKQARARAQLDMIESITRNIHIIHRAGEADLTEVITLRMIEALEEAAADKAVQSLMPQQIMSTLSQMHRLIERRD